MCQAEVVHEVIRQSLKNQGACAMKKWKVMFFSVLAVIAVLGLSAGSAAAEKETETETVQIRILSTSDVHGRFLPFDYALNSPDTSGSLAQISSAFRELADENTILIDVGDTIQGNGSELFIHDEIHPMVRAQNLMEYDVWVPGNHEFNFGMDVLENVIGQHESSVLCANVFQRDGTGIAEPYVILERSGVKIGVIGAVTPNITRWDKVNLEKAGITVRDPVQEVGKYAKELRPQVDVLIAACHMGFGNEYDVENSGTCNLADKVPELDLILSAHGHHSKYEYHNDVLMTQNKDSGGTLSFVTLTLEKEADSGFSLTGHDCEIIETGDYPEDPLISSDEVIAEADAREKEYMGTVIARLTDESLAPENEIPGIAQNKLEDTALLHLIHETQLYYTGAEISATALYSDTANLYRGDIRRCDLSKVYKYSNTLYKLRLTGAQIAKWIERSCEYYNTFREGDLTISFNPGIRPEGYIMFSGVKYEVDISEPPGSRVRNLRLEDGSPLEPDKKYEVATNNYIANAQLMEPGIVFEEEDGTPELLEIDVCGNIGGVRDLIGEYILNVKGIANEDGIVDFSMGEITDDHSDWKLTGFSWDAEKHARAAELVREGKLQIENTPDQRCTNIRSITETDLSKADPAGEISAA